MKTATAKDNIAKLPYECYSVLNTDKQLIKIKAGVSGFFRIGQAFPKKECERLKATMDDIADIWNTQDGVTKAQRMAMDYGSMFGWDIPAANPDNYTSDGHFKTRVKIYEEDKEDYSMRPELEE